MSVKNFYGGGGNYSIKSFVGTTEGQQYTQTLQEQKDALLNLLVQYVEGTKNEHQAISLLGKMETTIMNQCAKIANAPGCC